VSAPRRGASKARRSSSSSTSSCARRGTAIDRALATYAQDISGGATRTVKLDGGATLDGGSAAQLVAWVGHNRLMDLSSFDWPKPATTKQGTIAIACHTAAYMEESVSAEARVPLLMTRDFLFANAAPLEAAVLAFASGGGYAAIRNDAATAYAGVQKRPVADRRRVHEPADRRWKKR
jgi:hypothetical protein